MNANVTKTNGVKLFALVAVLAMVFACTAVAVSEESNAAGELNLSGTINGNQQVFEDGAVGVMNGNLLIEENKRLIIGDGAKFTVQANYTLTIAKNATLIVMQGAEFIVNGNIVVENGGTIQNSAMANGFQLNGNLTVEKGGVITNYSTSDKAPTCENPVVGDIKITTNESYDVAAGSQVAAGGTEVTESNGVYSPTLSNITYHMNAEGTYGYWVGVKIESDSFQPSTTYNFNINGDMKKITSNSEGDIYLYTIAGKVLDITISGTGITTPYHFVLDMRTNVEVADNAPTGQIILGADSVVKFNSTKSTPSSVAGQIFTLKNGASLDLDTVIGAPSGTPGTYNAATIMVETLSGENIINSSVTVTSATGAVTDLTFGTESQKAGTLWTDLDRNNQYTDKSTRYNYSILTVSGDVGTGVTLNVNSTINKIAQPDDAEEDAPAEAPVYGIVKVAEGQKLSVGTGATFTTSANSLFQVAGAVDIDGKKASSDETQSDVNAKYTLGGIVEISGTMDIGEYVAEAVDSKFYNTESTYLIVTGKVTFDESVDLEEIMGQMKGLYGVAYIEEVSNVDIPTISTLEAAIAVTDISEITISGYDKTDKVLAKPYEISANITIPEVTVTINNTLLVAEGVTLTISESADLEGNTTNGGLIVVEGTLIDYTMEEREYEDAPDAKKLYIDAEVRFVDADETYYMYTSLATALAGEPGTIALFGDVDISKNTTIPAGFTIELNGRTLTVKADAELTVEGVIDSTTPENARGTSTISIKTETGKDDGVLTLRNMIVNPNISSGAGYSTAVIAGFTANGTIGDYEDVHFLLAPAVAAANAATLYELETQGKVTYNGTLTFAAGEDNEGEVVTIDSETTITKIVLDGYGFTITKDGKFTGTVETTVTAGASSVTFDKAVGYTVGTTEDQSGDADVTKMTLAVIKDATATGKVTISSGTVELASDVTFGDKKENVLVIAEGATLVVPKDRTINVDGMTVYDNSQSKYVDVDADTPDKDRYVAITVDGTLTIKNGGQFKYDSGLAVHSVTVEINGTMNLARDVTFYGKVYVDGTLAVSMTEGEEGEAVVAGVMYVNGTVTGTVNFDNAKADSAVVLAYAGSSVDTANLSIVEGETTAKAMAVYVNGQLYMTVYGLEGVNVKAALQNDEFDITGYESVVWDEKVVGNVTTPATPWYSDAEYQNEIKIAEDNLGETPAAYVKLDPMVGKVQISVGPQMSVFIDGVKVNDTGALIGPQATVGDHKIEVTINPGFSGDVTITFNGQTISNGGTFTITPQMADAAADYVVLSVTGNLTQSPTVVDQGGSSDSGMGLTDYLLIVLVILIVVMAIMVAMRLMRS